MRRARLDVFPALLAEIDAEVRHLYLIGFVSNDERRDGQWRTIAVRVLSRGRTSPDASRLLSGRSVSEGQSAMTTRTTQWALVLATGAAALLILADVTGSEQPRATPPALRTDTIAHVARTRTPSVVFLHTMRESPQEPAPFGGVLTPRPSLPRSIPTIQEGLGSGVIVDPSGLILTNAHVIAGAEAIHFRTSDGDGGDAIVVGTDQDSDLALLRAQTLTAPQPAPLGDSARVNVGDWVVAIGSPLGLHHTVTAGIISAKARGIDDSGLEFLQTDAAINPGSSGGALFDLTGALVGITTAIVSAGGENIGLNFAIPIDVVKEVLPRLRAGDVVRGWIGIRMVDISRRDARALGIASGLVVIALADDGPAARAGIRIGDIVLGIAGPGPATSQDVYRRIRDTAPGAALTLTTWHDRQRRDVQVHVARRPRQE